MTPISTYVLDRSLALPVAAYCTLVRRLPITAITGLSAVGVRESATRIREAVLASGYEWPRQRVELELSNGTDRSASSGTELGLAVALLVASGQLSPDRITGFAFWGELSMAGEVRPVRGTLAAARAAQAQGLLLVTSVAGAARAARAGISAAALPSLAALADIVFAPATAEPEPWPTTPLDFGDIVLAEESLNALVAAARTRRPVLLVGPPGCGKTMIAARLPGILPALTQEDALEIEVLADVVGLGSTAQRPFRAPHYTISPTGLLGGQSGSHARFGELELALRGVLFLDALLEWPARILSLLRVDLREPDAPWLVLASDDGHEEGSKRHDRLLRHLDALEIEPVWIAVSSDRTGGVSRSSAVLRARVEAP